MFFMLTIYTYKHGITHYNAMFLAKCIDSNKKKNKWSELNKVLTAAREAAENEKSPLRGGRALPEQLQSEMDFGKGQVFIWRSCAREHSLHQMLMRQEDRLSPGHF